jgi:hypothetical protein
MKIFAILILSLFASPLYSQSDYAVTVKGDTLKGRTKILTYDILDRVQVVVNNKKKVFTALEVRSVFKDGAMYHTIKYDKGYQFMKLLKPGFLSLYAYRMPNQSGYDGRFLVKKDASSMEVPNLTFKKSMANFLESCKEVQERIKSGDLGRRDLDQIIDRYNSCLQFDIEKKVEKPVVISEAESEKMIAVNSLISKVEVSSDFAEKADVLDLLKDLRTKVGRNEILPNYISKDIKRYLSAQPQFAEDVEKLLALIGKK